MGRAFEAFEKAAPVERVSKDDLDTLAVVPVTAREQTALYKRLPLLLQRVRGLQTVRPPQTPECEKISDPAKDPNGCVVEAVRWLAGALPEAGVRIGQ